MEAAVTADFHTLARVALCPGEAMSVVEMPDRVGLPVDELQAVLVALIALRDGDASVRLPYHWAGVAGRVADAFNDVVQQNAAMAEELSRLRQVVGRQGKLKQRASLRETRGFWGQSIDCINSLIDDLGHPTSEVARVIGAVAQGDLSKSMALQLDGRPLDGVFLHTA
jgi:methyl-accepting chemotaxis protein